ncbi:MAG: hypothetical protein ACR2KF_08590 [Nitrososphaeraceae archaeon]
MNRSNPVVIPIKISKKKLAELHEVLKSRFTRHQRYLTIKEFCGGICCICGDIPSKTLVYDVDGAKLIEKYCNKCYKERIDKNWAA